MFSFWASGFLGSGFREGVGFRAQGNLGFTVEALGFSANLGGVLNTALSCRLILSPPITLNPKPSTPRKDSFVYVLCCWAEYRIILQFLGCRLGDRVL